MHIFKAVTADDAWCQAARVFLSDPTVSRQPSRAGPTRELLHASFYISRPRERWVLARRPALNPAFAIVEVIWILGGRRDAKLLTFWNRSLPAFAGSGEIYHGAYGFRLRQHFGLDQLERVYQVLLHNPASRQAVLQIWTRQEICPTSWGGREVKTFPATSSRSQRCGTGNSSGCRYFAATTSTAASRITSCSSPVYKKS